MKRILLSATFLALNFSVFAQEFDKQIVVNEAYFSQEVVMPVSPLTVSPLFIGGVDMVETSTGQAVAKEWHDFIGLTPDPARSDEFWVSVNHEMISKDDKIGDGGGMTVFKVKQNADGSITVLNQTLSDGRSGKYFNVDFTSVVGETGMNCGGIVSPDGRIWTAEEWWAGNNATMSVNGTGVRDTADFTIANTGLTGTFDGETVKKFQNFNYMVEIDPKQAKAIRKQYNWGRQPFEGGAVADDNKTVYLCADDVPAFFTKFVANTAGDFTSGKLYAFKQELAGTNKWVEIANGSIQDALNFSNLAKAASATMFCRLEWATIDRATGNVYFTETGRDDIGVRWPAVGNIANHHVNRASEKGLSGPKDSKYTDYYGRVLKYDVTTGEVTSYLEGGPDYTTSGGQHYSKYPSKHLSNPDGLSTIVIGGKTYLMVQEDLNGTSYNRMPYGISTPKCEMFLLDASLSNPTVDDLQRITVTPNGAEITGAIAFPNGKTILVNAQHPDANTDVNNYPYNHSLTIAISGLDAVVSAVPDNKRVDGSNFRVYPNPTSREVHLNKVTDAAIYDVLGNRLRVYRNTEILDVSGFAPGKYIIMTKENESTSLVIK